MPKGKGYSGKESMKKERTQGHPKSNVGKRAAAQNAKNRARLGRLGKK